MERLSSNARTIPYRSLVHELLQRATFQHDHPHHHRHHSSVTCVMTHQSVLCAVSSCCKPRACILHTPRIEASLILHVTGTSTADPSRCSCQWLHTVQAPRTPKDTQGHHLTRVDYAAVLRLHSQLVGDRNPGAWLSKKAPEFHNACTPKISQPWYTLKTPHPFSFFDLHPARDRPW
ncbi:hypothetical protein K505DRAFT_417909 [Melanomma pulvis-pyrius CBS 109.77]|uniref:Uncharacterized protein n=1 Tax=Melanomma pulvis-pyrius CBS 109.77 TaxID=1314802 RepID=A0A6A6XAI3_9PLEO|nr:hypothetical protein K505DRAFT_417909 [Melanomma pulvis-pyrius CBS 109.77]